MALFTFGYEKKFLNEDKLSKQNTKDKNKSTMTPMQGVQTAIQYTANELKGIKLKVDHDSMNQDSTHRHMPDHQTIKTKQEAKKMR